MSTNPSGQGTKPRTFRSPRWAIGSQYFLYFGVLGMFLPYFNLYCHHIGFSGFQIGAISGLRSVTLVVFPLLWGLAADRFNVRRSIYIACNFLSTAIWAGFFLSTDFRILFLLTACYGIFYAPIISFLETFSLEALGKAKERYGRVRAWGSISFIAVVIVLGHFIDRFSVEIILATILAGSALLSVSSLKIPKVKVTRKEPLLPHVRALLGQRAAVFLLSAFFMLVSHGTYYGFFSIHLKSLGYGSTFIGAAWALASASEILVMIRSGSIFHRFPIEKVLVFSFVAAAVRWFALFFIVSPGGILITQLLHAVTYGTFHMASILYIDRLSPEKAKTLGQAVNNALTYGLGLMTGFFLNGWLYDILGAQMLFAVSGAIALAGGLVFSRSKPAGIS